MKARIIEMRKPDETNRLDYQKECLALIESPMDPKLGLSVPEIQSRIELRREVAKSNGQLVLSEEHYAALRNIVELTHFTSASEDIWAFIEAVRNAEIIDMVPKE